MGNETHNAVETSQKKEKKTREIHTKKGTEKHMRKHTWERTRKRLGKHVGIFIKEHARENT